MPRWMNGYIDMDGKINEWADRYRKRYIHR